MTVKEKVLDAGGVFFKRHVQIEAVGVGGELESALEDGGAGARTEAAVEKRARPVGDDFRGVEIVFRPEAVAGRTGAVGRIEAEGARLELRHADAAIGTSEFFGKDVLAARHDGDGDEPAGELERRGDGLLQAGSGASLDEQAVHDDFDGVILALVQGGRVVEGKELAVNPRANVAVLRELFELLAVGAFATAYDGRQDHDAVVGTAKLAGENGLNDGFTGLAGDGLAAIGAVRNADGRIHDAKVIVDFGDGADGGARRTGGGFLLDGNGGGKAFDDVHVGTLHLIEELTGVSGKGFDVAALAFGVDGVKGKGRFAGAGEAGDNGQCVTRNFDVDVLEIVLPRAPDNQLGQPHSEIGRAHV